MYTFFNKGIAHVYFNTYISETKYSVRVVNVCFSTYMLETMYTFFSKGSECLP